MTDAQIPEIGIHYDVPFETYCEWDAMNQSRLKVALRSLKKYKYGPPYEPSDAMRLGSLIHTTQLEPDKVRERYVVMPEFDKACVTSSGDVPKNPKATKQYKDLVAEWEERNTDREVVTQEWMDRTMGLVLSMSQDAKCREYLQDGRREASVVWLDCDSGMLCKARIDNLQYFQGRAVDLKSTRDITRFLWSMFDYGYHIQAAFYLDGLAAVAPGEFGEFGIVAVETDQPYECGAAPVSPAAIRQGRLEYKRALQLIRKSEHSGLWPGFQSPDAWELPTTKQKTIVSVQGRDIAVC